MKRRYKFYLVKYLSIQKKTITATCANITEALALIKTEYPGWKISMFWPEWP